MKKGILQIMLANIIYLLISLFINFILPKYLSIESYAEIKSYILYINYAGLFHLGLIDGIYLKYGGKDLCEISRDECKTDFVGLFFLEIIFSLFILCIGFVCDDIIIKTYSLGLFTFNLLSFFKNFYQATGAFGKYSMALNCETLILFLCYVCLIFLFVIHENSLPYIIVRIVIISILCLFCYRDLKLHIAKIESIRQVYNNILCNVKQGILLMFGNFATVCFSGIDRWFVLLFLNQRSFAIYAFAVGMEQAINTFVTPITLSMYNYLCKHDNLQDIKRIKNLTMIWGFLVISGGFFAKYIIDEYLPKYSDATILIFLLFSAMGIHTVIKGIYLNVYKAKRKQNIYFFQMIAMILVAILLDFIFYRIFQNMVCIAVATFVVAVIWLIICELYDKYLRFNVKEFVVLALLISLYLSCGYAMTPIMGFVTYLLGFTLVLCFLMRNEFLFGLENIKAIFKGKIKM